MTARKRTYFYDVHDDGWPRLKWLEPFFLTARGRAQAFSERESWGLKIHGIEGTENLEPYKGRIDIGLHIQGDLTHGILLWYNKSGGGKWEAMYSKGDPTKMNQWIETIEGDPLPVGLFISFETAWTAVKEFLEREGALPTSIEWIADKDLPENAFLGP